MQSPNKYNKTRSQTGGNGSEAKGGAHDDFREDLVAPAPGDGRSGQLDAAGVDVDPILGNKDAAYEEESR